MKPSRGLKTPVEIISRSESVLGPSATFCSSSALCLRSSRSSCGARRLTSVPPCGTLVVYSVSTFIRSPPRDCGIRKGEPAPHPSSQAGHAVIPGTLAHDPEPQLVGVAAGDLEKAVAAHSGALEVPSPLIPEKIGDEARVTQDARSLLRPLLEQGAHLRSQLCGLLGQGEYLACFLQSVPHRFMLGRGTVRPRVVAQVLFVVYEQRGVRIEGPLQAAEGHPLVQSVQLMERIRLVKRPHLEFFADVREGFEALLSPDQDARVPVLATDAPHRDIRRVPHKVRAFVAA